jgi:hypothetical protein
MSCRGCALTAARNQPIASAGIAEYHRRMKMIPLTQGKAALVDDADAYLVSRYKWFAVFDGHNWYAATKKNSRQLRMHNLLTTPPEGMEVDHEDRNGLNNQRSNLRVCAHRNNGRNRAMNSDNTSGFKGVSWKKREGGWCAQITISPIVKWLGLFDDKKEAAKAYDAAAELHFGEFAITNKKLGLL